MSGDWARRPDDVPPHTLVGAFAIQEMPVRQPVPAPAPDPLLRTVAEPGPGDE